MEGEERQAATLDGQLFYGLFNAASIGIALENLEGRPLVVNPALCSMLGFSEEEMRNKLCVQFSPPEDAEKDWALFQQLRSGSIDHYHLEKRFFRKDGTLIWGRLSISLLNGRVGASPLVVAMVEDITEIKEAEEKLRRSELNLQNLAGRLIQAQEDERHRVGRELHDDIAQRLALHEIDLENLRTSLAEAGQDSQAQLVSELHLKIDELTRDVHDLSRDLHSSRLQFLGLPDALRELCEKVSAQQRIPIKLHVAELPKDIPADLTLCIYRIAQEALSNVVKHSRTHEALIELACSEDTIVLKITDFGVGFDPSAPQAGIGFASMRERLRVFGGELFAESVPGDRTEIVARVKIEKANAAAG